MKTIQTTKKRFNTYKIFIIATTTVVVVMACSFIGLKVWIKSEAKSVAKHAVEVFQIGQTESMVAMLESGNATLNEKNKVVWALGVLKDRDALEKLESMVTHKECNHNEALCQYELNKAISKIKGGCCPKDKY